MKKIRLEALALNENFKLRVDTEIYSVFRICGSVILAKCDGKIHCFSYNRKIIKC
jgi:hypothetical protein